MVTRNLYCPQCGFGEERTALQLKEPSRHCPNCDSPTLEAKPTFPCGTKLIGEGFHCNDYPKSAEQLIKDYGLEKHDSTNPNSDFNRNPDYAAEMAEGAGDG